MKAQNPRLDCSPLAKIRNDVDHLIDQGDTQADVSSAGLKAGANEKIWSAVEAWYRTGTQPFVSICIRRRGQKILHRSIGHSHGSQSADGLVAGSDAKVGNVNTPVMLFSASKAVTAMVMHGLAEDGLLDLDQRVSHYLPKFDTAEKRRFTLSEILTHQSGFPTMPGDLPDDKIFDNSAVVEALFAQPSATRCKRTAYHALSGGFILGAIAEKVSGKNLNQLLRQRIARPMGLQTFAYGANKTVARQVAQNYSTGPAIPFPLSGFVKNALGADWDTVVEMSNRPEFLQHILPSANVVATSDEICQFMEMLRLHGRLNNKTVFEAQTIERAIQVKNSTLFDHTLKIPMRYSEGFMLGNFPFGMYGPLTRSAFGHLGFINIFCWADPERETSVALLSTGKSLLGLHVVELARLLWVINAQTRSA